MSGTGDAPENREELQTPTDLETLEQQRAEIRAKQQEEQAAQGSRRGIAEGEVTQADHRSPESGGAASRTPSSQPVLAQQEATSEPSPIIQSPRSPRTGGEASTEGHPSHTATEEAGPQESLADPSAVSVHSVPSSGNMPAPSFTRLPGAAPGRPSLDAESIDVGPNEEQSWAPGFPSQVLSELMVPADGDEVPGQSEAERARQEEDIANTKRLMDVSRNGDIVEVDEELVQRVEEAMSSDSPDCYFNRGLLILIQYEKQRRRTVGDHNLKMLTDSLKSADAYFSKALEIDRDFSRALMGKAMLHMEQKEWNKALPLLRQVLYRAAVDCTTQARKDNLKQVRWLIALCFNGLQRFEQMRNALVSVLDIDPENVESLCALFETEMLPRDAADGDEGPNTSFLAKALQINNKHPAVLCQLANNAFFTEYDPDNGVDGSSDDRFKMALSMLERAFSSTSSPQLKAEVHFQRGRIKHVQQRLQEAEHEYKSSYLLNDDHYASKFGYSRACMALRKYSDAIQMCENIRKKRGNMPEVLKLELASRYKLSKQSPTDRKLRREVLKIGKLLTPLMKNDDEVWAMIADAHHELNKLQRNDHVVYKDELAAYETFATIISSMDPQDLATKESVNPQMFNNLGVLRMLQNHDVAGAHKACDIALKTAEERAKTQLDAKQKKENDLAILTAKFNITWLLEQEKDPSSMQTMLQYMKFSQEHDWYGLPLLQICSHWIRSGANDQAYDVAAQAGKKGVPVIGCLMQAEIARHRGDYKKSEQLAEKAVRASNKKEDVFACCNLGNICFQAASSSKTVQERLRYMNKALYWFVTVLSKKKDCKYACNGVAMVLAQMGNMDAAQRIFEYVNQHGGMKKHPALYLNLAHTYMKPRGKMNQSNRTRKAIALYQMAQRLKPTDLSIRLFLASAQFELQEFGKCIGILSDALLMWPEDVLLRFNYGIALETFGVHLIAAEKKRNRIVAQQAGMTEMTRALGLLHSARRQFAELTRLWQELSREEKINASKLASSAFRFRNDMKRIHYHLDYCEHMMDTAVGEQDSLKATKHALDSRMKEIFEERDRQAKERDEAKLEEKERAQERQFELEEQAIKLMSTTSTFGLGANLEAVTLDKPVSAAARGAKAQKAAKEKKVKERLPLPAPEGEEGDLPPEEGEEAAQAARAARGASRSPAPRRGRAKALSKKEKKEMKKQAKKDKKAAKKAKRGEASSGSESGGRAGASEPGEGGPVPLTMGDEEGREPLLPTSEAKELLADEDSEERRQRKKDKKERKEAKKKEKKEKKKRKRGEASEPESGGDDDDADLFAAMREEGEGAETDEPPTSRPRTEAEQETSANMEQELFGSDSD